MTQQILKFFVTTRLKHPFSTILLLGISSVVQGVVLGLWVKRKEHCMNVVLNILVVIKAVQFGHILMNVKALNKLKT